MKIFFKKFLRWLRTLLTGKQTLPLVSFKGLTKDQLYLRAGDPSGALVSRKGEWKRSIEDRARALVAKEGGTFIRINWKKQKLHYITKTGKRVAG